MELRWLKLRTEGRGQEIKDYLASKDCDVLYLKPDYPYCYIQSPRNILIGTTESFFLNSSNEFTEITVDELLGSSKESKIEEVNNKFKDWFKNR